MKKITRLSKLLQRFIYYTQSYNSLVVLIIGGYKLSISSIRLADALGSSLNDTNALVQHPEWGLLVPTELFIQDAQKVIAQPELLRDFIHLWEPVLNRLLRKSGTSTAALCQLPLSAAKYYQAEEEGILAYWIDYVSRIKNELTSFLKETKDEILQQIQTEAQLLREEKQQLEEAHHRIVAENQHYQIHGHVASNQCTLSPASPEMRQEVERSYQFNRVPGYDIGDVEVIYNPAHEQQFELCMKILQARKNETAFAPKWQTVSEDFTKKSWRETVYQFFKQLCQPFTNPKYPDVKQIYMWHGTSKMAFNSILTTGYANLATTDAGFFGKGIYGTSDAEYAHRVYAQKHASNGVLVINKMCFFSGYPTIEGEFFMGEANYANYDAHFALVSPRGPGTKNEVNYDPSALNTLHTYVELVVFNGACLPRYHVHLKPSLAATIKRNPGQQAYYVAEQCEQAQQPLVAYYYFMQAKKRGETNAESKINDLLQTHPEYNNTFKIT